MNILVSFPVDEDTRHSWLDNELRISCDDVNCYIWIEKNSSGDAYIAATIPLAEFKRALSLIGVTPDAS